jgi:hypothetical protein
MQHDDNCANCNGNNFRVDHVAGIVLCSDCSMVVDGGHLSNCFHRREYPRKFTSRSLRRFKKSFPSAAVRAVMARRESKASAKYQPATYWRELWRLFRGQEPVVPDDDFRLIAMHCQERFGSTLTKDNLRVVLHDIDRLCVESGQRPYFVRKYLVSMSLSVCVT